jgi:hypothetical protein
MKMHKTDQKSEISLKNEDDEILKTTLISDTRHICTERSTTDMMKDDNQ